VLEAADGPMPVDELKEAYSKQLGHKLAIERFLVIGDVGLAGTLRRIPHVATVSQDGLTVSGTLEKGSNKESLIAADQVYRRTLKQKNEAAKSGAAKPSSPTAAAAAPASTVGQTRPSEGGSEPEAKKQKPEDKETLSRMLVQGVIRVLQNRVKDGKGPLLVNDLPEEFKTLWKVDFNLQSAGYTDVDTFLKAWPQKLELSKEGTNDAVVSLVKKSAEKAKAEPASTKAPSAPSVPEPSVPPVVDAPATAKKAPPAVPPKAEVPAAVAPAAAPPPAVESGEPEAKKAKGADQDTLSRMLVQGVIRVLQNRAKEGKGPLLLSQLPEEFHTLWKVSFNLKTAGYTDVVVFVKAWSNKLELTSSPEGDVISLVKKSAEKAKAEPPAAKAPAVSQAPKASGSAAAQPAERVPVASTAVIAEAAAPGVPSSSSAVPASIPTTATELRKELLQTMTDLESLTAQQKSTVARQMALIEALAKAS
jgi:uncharacterized protein (DUF2267 family)